MVRELRVCQDLTIKFSVMSNEVALDIDSVQGLSKQFLDNVFEFCAEVPLCKGFEFEVNSPKTVQGNAHAHGITEHWEMCDDQGIKTQSIRHRARNCLSILSYNTHEMKCRNCVTLKQNCRSYRKNESDHDGQELKKQKRISYMNPEEISSRLHIEQARVKNAEKRAERAANAKEEIQKQMEDFTEEDHNDFKSMFGRIDESKVNDDMKMFWEAQKQVLENPDSRANRWHPK